MRTRQQGKTGSVSKLNNTLEYYYAKNLVSTTPASTVYPVSDCKITIDEVHPNYPKDGGPLSIRSINAQYTDPKVKSGYVLYSGYIHDYHRLVLPKSIPGFPLDSSADCAALGPEGWDRFRPAKPRVSLGQFLVELRDFPRMLEFRLTKFKELGSAYLNAQFGWKPFISDIRSFFQSLSRLDEQLARLKNENGKWIRKGGTINFDQNSWSLGSYNMYLTPNNFLDNIRYSGSGSSITKSWFKGSFRYYIPGLSEGKWGTMRSISKLWGLELTPDLVWNLIPFSWLVDWVSNAGNVISNYSSIAFDHMAAKSAYVMLHKTTETECIADYRSRLWTPGMTNFQYGQHRSSTQIRVETKARAVASPFGFNLTWDDFNPFQVSILAALGISRL